MVWSMFFMVHIIQGKSWILLVDLVPDIQIEFCSGRLPYTIGKSAADYGTQVVTTGSSTSNILQLPYSEGLFIDYRHFDQANITPRFEYGFGLSYTTFQYSSLSITGSVGSGSPSTGPGSSLDPWYAMQRCWSVFCVTDPKIRLHTKVVTVTFSLTNNGSVAGHEVSGNQLLAFDVANHLLCLERSHNYTSPSRLRPTRHQKRWKGSTACFWRQDRQPPSQCNCPALICRFGMWLINVGKSRVDKWEFRLGRAAGIFVWQDR